MKLMNALGFTPEKTTCQAYFETVGEVPQGEAVWRVHDGVAWVDRMLTVQEMSTADADALETHL